ncbi:hypothetical protein J2Z31_003075 [Sinorhizobium kostiense]|uniref:Uncharacterized protein n=1 Tax=Sinorhizobium kostiense TaxID=76747 RepID=A0ABS4R2F6_9HYPH|nr:hypothetical protein [Sinorhizobium kostiense]
MVIEAPVTVIECRLRDVLTNESFLGAAKKVFAVLAYVACCMAESLEPCQAWSASSISQSRKVRSLGSDEYSSR